MSNGWIGVDLDGTLAHYDRWRGADHIGEPVGPMLERVKRWIAEGVRVKIFTARVSLLDSEYPVARTEALNTLRAIEGWCEQHIGAVLPVTCKKDYSMVELWDDRAVQVIPNTGVRADGK